MSLSPPMQSWSEEQERIASAFAFAAARHDRLCPRQVLGVRAGFAGARALGFDLTTRDHRVLTIVETDGCFVDGIEAATGCAVGHRTLRVEDYGRIAATFIDTASGAAFRVAPRPDVRDRAGEYASGEARHYYAQLIAAIVVSWSPGAGERSSESPLPWVVVRRRPYPEWRARSLCE